MDSLQQQTDMLNLLKKRLSAKDDRFEKENIILLKRIQVSVSSPAIARVEIRIPESITLTENILSYHMSLKNEFSSYGQTIEKVNDNLYVLEIKGVLRMYDWMEFFITQFRQDYGDKYKIEVEGSWDHY